MSARLVLDHLNSEAEENARRAQIIAGARAVVLSQGFDAARMGEIARAAGVSKGTLYVSFKNEEELFKAIVEIESIFQAEAIFKFDAADADVEGTLAPVGVAFVQKLCEPDRHLSMRAVIAIADRMPSIGRMFYETGPAVGIAKMREYLGAEVAAGRLNIPTAKWRRHSSWICATHAVQADVLQLRPAAASGADRVRGWPRREDLYGGVPEAVRRRHSGEWSTVGLCSVDGSSCAH